MSGSQKFIVNEAHWQRPDGPVFLFIGGEGPIYNFDVLTGTVAFSFMRLFLSVSAALCSHFAKTQIHF